MPHDLSLVVHVLFGKAFSSLGWPCVLIFVSLTAAMLPLGASESAESPVREHPLLPGVRSPEVWNPQWPTTMHDQILTGFSPLNCGMSKPPEVWATMDCGGVASNAIFVPDGTGQDFLLVQDSSLRRIDKDGNVVWSRGGYAIFYEQLHGDGTYTLGLVAGTTLFLVDPATGLDFWRYEFPVGCSLWQGKIRVGPAPPEIGGKCIAVFPGYCEEGYLFVFSNGRREPQLLWKTTEASVPNLPRVADHGVQTLIEPDGSVIWNIRRWAVLAFDARTGKLLQRREFESGGEKRRDYGPPVLGKARDGTPLLVVNSQAVEMHLTGFKRTASTPMDMLFDHWIGYVYSEEALGSALFFTPGGLGDVNGDGALEIVYSVRVGQPKPQSRTVICDAATGEEQVIPDAWLVGLVDIDGDGKREILTYADPNAEMPDLGSLHIYRFDDQGRPQIVSTFDKVQVALRPQGPIEQPPDAAWSQLACQTPVLLQVGGERGLLVTDLQTGDPLWLSASGEQIAARTGPPSLAGKKVLAIGSWAPAEAQQLAVQSADGRLQVLTLGGETHFDLPLKGGGTPRVSAADLDGDGHCEVIVATPLGRVNVYRISAAGKADLLWSAPFTGSSGRLSVPARDINGDGKPEVLGIGSTPEATLCVRSYDANGAQLWETPLPMPSSGDVKTWIVGQFLGPGKPGIFVSAEQGTAREDSYMLDGATGAIVWVGQRHMTPVGWRNCNPNGIPTAFDADGDGTDDLMLDYLDYFAILRGADGRLMTELISTVATPLWKLAYNSYIPIYETGEQRPYFLVPLGFGGVVLLKPDLATEVWGNKTDYDAPQKAGMVDVDGDGRPEVGFEHARDGLFLCCDLWTGQEKWRLQLPSRGYGPVISADFDGDGKGEFLIGTYCLGVDDKGQGAIRWQMSLPASPGWPAIADVDGDGKGEIIVPCSDSTVRILKAAP